MELRLCYLPAWPLSRQHDPAQLWTGPVVGFRVATTSCMTESASVLFIGSVPLPARVDACCGAAACCRAALDTSGPLHSLTARSALVLFTILQQLATPAGQSREDALASWPC